MERFRHPLGYRGPRGDDPGDQTEHPQDPEEPGHRDQHDSNPPDECDTDQHDTHQPDQHDTHQPDQHDTGNGDTGQHDTGQPDQHDTGQPDQHDTGQPDQYDTGHTGNGDTGQHDTGQPDQHDTGHTGNGDTGHTGNGDTGHTEGEGTVQEPTDQDINIVGWPPTLSLEHKTDPSATPKVSVGFESSPVQMNMDMNVANTNPFKVCIQLCEPITVKSSYTIGIDVFDRPVAAITLNGTTTIYNSPEEQ